jgi:hypothetical protein
MLLVATILVALLAGGGVALYLQLQSTKSATHVKSSTSSLFCAEGGVVAARPIIALNVGDWTTVLGGGTVDWYPVRGDLDADGVDDYEVTIRDNDDEAVATTNDPTVDVDQTVFAVGTCLKNSDAKRQVVELIVVGTGAHIYRNQAGGGGFNAGNQNN